jgi:hypothetical protein
MTTPAAHPVPDTFTCADRCDRCGAQARVRVPLAAGELLFCGHHSAQHADALTAALAVATLSSATVAAVVCPPAALTRAALAPRGVLGR